MSLFRREKLAELYKREATSFLQKNLFVADTVFSITNVELADKLNRLKIYFSVWPDQKAADMIKSLEKIKRGLRAELSDKVRTKFSPEIEFVLDESEKKRMRFEELLDK